MSTFINSDVSEIAKEVALFNLAYLRVQLFFKPNWGTIIAGKASKTREGDKYVYTPGTTNSRSLSCSRTLP